MAKCPHCGEELSESDVLKIHRSYLGSKKSKAKAASSAKNGRLGGRPKGSKNTERKK